METFRLEDTIHQDVCGPTFGEKLACCHDSKNTEGLFVVAVKHRTTIVSHASRSCLPSVLPYSLLGREQLLAPTVDHQISFLSK